MGDEWLSLRQASDMTGKSVNALRLLVNRKRFDMVKREERNGKSYWLIHHDSLVRTCGQDQGMACTRQGAVISHANNNMVTIEYHDSKRKEWEIERDTLRDGFNMYRWKFEELDRQMKLLPAPVETVSARLQDQEQRIRDLETELEQAKQPWWKKLFGGK